MIFSLKKKEKDMKISVIIPAYNESGCILSSLQKITAFLKLQFKNDWEILVVDDGSADGMAASIQKEWQNEKKIKILINETNMGKGYSVRRGVLAAKGELVLFTDADLSTPIKDFLYLKTAVEEDADIAIGSRAFKSSSVQKYDRWYRKVMGKVFNFFVRLFVIRDYKDTQCGFKLFRKQCIKQIFSNTRIDGFAFDSEVLYLAHYYGYQVKEVHVNWYAAKESKVRLLQDTLSMFFSLLRIFIYKLSGKYKITNKP